MKIRLLIILGIMFLSFHLFADGRKTIQVKFTISEPQYKKYFHRDSAAIVNSCSSFMVDLLEKTFGFFHFTTMENKHVLNIELINKERTLNTNSGLKEVGFNVHIKQQENRGSVVPVYWVLRPAEQSDLALPDNKEIFINEVIQSFIKGVSRNKEALVKNILSQVEVANDFYFEKDQKYFFLPIAGKDNNIGKQSQLLIITSVSGGILEPIDLEVTAEVISFFKDRKEAIRLYQLSESYPEGSIAAKKLADSPGETPVDFSNTNAIQKKIFILKHSAYIDSEIKISPPNSNP